MHLLHRLRHLAEDAAVDVVCEFDRFLHCISDRDYSDVHLVLPRQTQPHEDADPKIDQVSVRARHVGVRIEHENIVGEDKAKVTVEAENLW
jgi:hypothetical protein